MLKTVAFSTRISQNSRLLLQPYEAISCLAALWAHKHGERFIVEWDCTLKTLRLAFRASPSGEVTASFITGLTSPCTES